MARVSASALACLSALTMGATVHVEAATTDKYLTGWWHNFDIGYGVGDTPFNYRPPAGNGDEIKSSIVPHFDTSMNFNYSLQQHDMVRPGFWGGAYWGVGADLVYQTLDGGYGGTLDATSIMIIPKVQVGLSFRYGKRLMLQTGGFLGFGLGITSFDVEGDLGDATKSSTTHQALAFQQGVEAKLRYSFNRKSHVGLGLIMARREVANSRETWDLGTATAETTEFGVVLNRNSYRFNTDVEQNLFVLTAGLGYRF